MSYLLLYVPVTLVALLVYEACRHDDAKVIAFKTLKDFGILSGVFAIGGAIIYIINRFL
jgi:hypothetical protein